MENKKKIGILVCIAAIVVTIFASLGKVHATGEQTVSNTSTTGSAENQSEVFEVSLDKTLYVLADTSGKSYKTISSDWKQDTLGSEYSSQTVEETLPVEMKITYTLDGKQIDGENLVNKSGHLVIRFDYENMTSTKAMIQGVEKDIHIPYIALTGMLLDGDATQNIKVTNGKAVSDGKRIIVAGIAVPGIKENFESIQDLEIPEYVEVEMDVTDYTVSSTYTILTNDLMNIDNASFLDEFDGMSEDMDSLKDAMELLLDGSKELADGLSTLYDKTGELKDGVTKLDDGAKQLSDGLNTLASGTNSLNEGVGTLSSGVTSISTGAGSLSGGLGLLSENSAALNDGAKQVFSIILSTANSQLQANDSLKMLLGSDVPALTMDNYGQVTDTLLAALDADQVYATAMETAKSQISSAVYSEENQALIKQGVTQAVLQQVTAQVNEQVTAAVRAGVETEVRNNTETISAAVTQMVKESVKAQVTQGYQQNVLNAILQSQSLSEEEYLLLEEGNEVKTMIDASVLFQMNSEEAVVTIEQLTEQQMASDEVQSTISENTEAQIQLLIAQNMSSDEVVNKISTLTEQNVTAQMASESVQDIIATNVQQQSEQLIASKMLDESVQSQISAACAQANEGAGQIASLKASLESYQSFYDGLLTYTQGVDSAYAGAKQLSEGIDTQLKPGVNSLVEGVASLNDGAKKLNTGANELSNGLSTLSNGTNTLRDGVRQLKDGSGKLHDGLVEFDEEGIEKLVDLFEDDLQEVLDTLSATLDSVDIEENSTSRYIIKTDSAQ